MKIVGDIFNVEIIAEGHGVCERKELRRHYGYGNWRKLKGIALVESPGGYIGKAEIHWYEAHGIGKVKMKVKRWL